MSETIVTPSVLLRGVAIWLRQVQARPGGPADILVISDILMASSFDEETIKDFIKLGEDTADA